MAKYDHGGGCACGLYKECSPGCNNYVELEMTKNNNYDFDFGFTAVTEAEIEKELPSVQEALSDRERAVDYEKRLDKLHAAIIPLLDNLRKNPESEYIKWPDRDAKIDAFETYIADIVNGDI